MENETRDLGNVSSFYKSGSLKTVARKSAKYILDLIGGQEFIFVAPS
jgi:hypothetical protein